MYSVSNSRSDPDVNFSRTSSVISAFAPASNSPVSLSITSLANTCPIKYSPGTFNTLSFAFSISLIWRAVILRSISTMTFPFLSLISKDAISPRKRSGMSSSAIPFFDSVNLLVSKNISSTSSVVNPSARNNIVAGILRRRSIRQ